MELEGPDARLTIDPEAGGRLTSMTVDGWELLVPFGKDVFHWGSFAMAPWAGRLRQGRLAYKGTEYELPINSPPHSLHGLVTDRVWHQDGPGRVAVELAPPWPWHGRVTHTVTLASGLAEFVLTLDAQEPMPASLGWHPWFSTWITRPDGQRAGPSELRCEPRLMYANDADGLPTGELTAPAPRPWDYCFRDLVRPPSVRWPGALELTVESNCEDWVIYEQEPQGTCIEPWTAPPNALNLPDPPIVMPGSPLTATMRWRWHPS